MTNEQMAHGIPCYISEHVPVGKIVDLGKVDKNQTGLVFHSKEDLEAFCEAFGKWRENNG